MSYNSKYTGQEVEGLLDRVANGEISGGITVETDPIFSNSPAASITNEKMTEWNNKVDKVDGKQLSTEDFTTTLKQKLDGLSNYDDTNLRGDLMWIKAEGEAGVRLKGTNGTATGNLAISAGDDKTASDGTAFTSAASGDHAVVFGYGNTCAGRSTLAQGLYNTVNGKDAVAFGQRNLVGGDQAFAAGQQNEVTARLGVAIGYKNKATNTDSIVIGYQNTSSGSASVAVGDTCESSGTSSTAMGYKTKASGAYSVTFGENTQATNAGETAMGTYNKSTTSTDISEQTAFSFGIGTSDTNRMNALEVKKNGDVYIGDKLLSDVATSGDYNDLSNKPTIPDAVTEDTVSGWGFTKNTGTVTKVKVNGVEKSPSSGVVDVGSLVSSVKINGFTHTPTNGLVDLGTIESGGGGISSLGFPTNYYDITLVTETRTVVPYVHYIFTFGAWGDVGINITFNDTTEGIRTPEYVLAFEYFEGNVNLDVTSYPIQWYNNEPPVFDGTGTLIYIFGNIGFWLNYEV